ncbi:Rare lipoprotein A, partial [Pseudomonas coronafaciens pv. oryzae]
MVGSSSRRQVMRAMPIRQSLKLLALSGLALLVASCSSPSRTTSTQAPKGGAVVRSMPGLDINRAHKDGAPWWD